MNRSTIAWIVVASVLPLTSCSSAAPPRTQYLLRSGSAASVVGTPAPFRVALGRITLAPYLRQPGIVIETEPGQIRAAQRQQWAEPLADGLRSYLRSAMSAALGYEVSADALERVQWDYTIDVYVDRLHGSMTGAALIDASYRVAVRGAAAHVAEYQFSRSVPLPRGGYTGLVEAETQLVRELADAIAASLKQITGT